MKIPSQFLEKFQDNTALVLVGVELWSAKIAVIRAKERLKQWELTDAILKDFITLYNEDSTGDRREASSGT